LYRKTHTVVNRVLHKHCQRFFYEIYGQEYSRCPHCRKSLPSNSRDWLVVITHSKNIMIDPESGNLMYE